MVPTSSAVFSCSAARRTSALLPVRYPRPCPQTVLWESVGVNLMLVLQSDVSIDNVSVDFDCDYSVVPYTTAARGQLHTKRL